MVQGTVPHRYQVVLSAAVLSAGPGSTQGLGRVSLGQRALRRADGRHCLARPWATQVPCLGCTPGAGPSASGAEGVSLAHSTHRTRIRVPLHLNIMYQTRPQSRGEEAVLESRSCSVAHALTCSDSCVTWAGKLLSVSSSFVAVAPCASQSCLKQCDE